MLNILTQLKGKGEGDKGAQEVTVVSDPQQIVQLLTEAVQKENFVTVTIPGEQLQFYTLFVQEENSADYLKQRSYVLVAPLDPPIGNMKLRSAKQAQLNFFTDRYVVTAQLDFQQNVANKFLKLSFPAKVNCSSQKRSGVRVKPDRRLKIPLTITRPSGIPFTGQILDISIGGLAFEVVGREARLEHGAKVTFYFEPPDDAAVKVDGVVLGVVQKEGTGCIRARFLLTSSHAVRQTGELVAYVQRDTLQRRKEMFS